MLEQRFQKLAAMAPVVTSPTSDMLKEMDHTRLRSQLSPISTGRVSQLEAPTKKGLNDYDKAMSSLEASVKKAMKTCSDHINKVKQEREKEKARLQQLEKIRQRKASSLQKAIDKAQQEGEELANKEMVHQDSQASADDCEDDDAEADDDDSGAWALVSDADELLSVPKGGHFRAFLIWCILQTLFMLDVDWVVT